MSGRFTTRDFERALLRKGFVRVKGAKHAKLALIVEQMQSSIQTVASRSNYTVDDSLASKMANQLYMPSIGYLRRFVECEVSGEEYVRLLLDSGVI